MRKPLCFESGLHNDRIVTDLDYGKLFNLIMERNIVVRKNVFPEHQLKSVREMVREWGERTPITPPRTSCDDNFHAIEKGISPVQKTPHIYHAYNFKQIHQLDEGLRDRLLAIFDPIRHLTNSLKGVTVGYAPSPDGKKLHPQIIQYPRGGSMFGPHVHPLEPQQLGPFLSLSHRGSDFTTGSVGFEVDGEAVDTEENHDIGDLVLFRFDIRHWVTFVDPEYPLDFKRGDGRWTATLSYY